MDLKAFMTSYYQTYNSADAAALAPFYHSDAKLLSAQGELVGRSAILDTYQYIIEHFDDRMTPVGMIAEEEWISVEIEDRFTAREPVADFLGRSFAPGDQFTLHLCGIYACDAGAIRHISLYNR